MGKPPLSTSYISTIEIEVDDDEGMYVHTDWIDWYIQNLYIHVAKLIHLIENNSILDWPWWFQAVRKWWRDYNQMAVHSMWLIA